METPKPCFFLPCKKISLITEITEKNKLSGTHDSENKPGGVDFQVAKKTSPSSFGKLNPNSPAPRITGFGYSVIMYPISVVPIIERVSAWQGCFQSPECTSPPELAESERTVLYRWVPNRAWSDIQYHHPCSFGRSYNLHCTVRTEERTVTHVAINRLISPILH